MPKETVFDQAGMYDVTVGWEAGRWVQIGVRSHDRRPIVEHLAGGPDADGDPAQFTGLWGTLDREGCNRLIRNLRRARDAAYGQDE